MVYNYQKVSNLRNLEFQFKPELGMLMVLIFMILMLSANAMAQTNWTEVAPSNLPRIESHCAMVGDKMYVIGGFITASWKISNTVEVYDPKTNIWSYAAAMPATLTHRAVAVNGNEVWLIGGFSGGTPKVAQAVVHIYNTSTNVWRRGPNLPFARASQGAARIGRKIHVVGGLLPDRQTDTNEHFVLDLDNVAAGWKVSTPMPQAKNHFGTAAVAGKLYAIGGQSGHDGAKVDFKTVFRYDPMLDKWESVADLPKPHGHFEPGTSVVDGKILIAGGTAWSAGISNEVNTYDPKTNVWTVHPILSQKLLACNARVMGGQLIVANGGSGSSGPVANTRVRAFVRTVTDELAFYTSQLNVIVEDGVAVNKQVLLYTLSNEANYTIQTATLPTWLKILNPTGKADQGAASLKMVLNPTGLAAGTYQTNVIAKAAGYADAILPVTFQVGNGGGAPQNQSPLVNAGVDRNMTLPQNSVSIFGQASDPDGTIGRYAWSKLSGPSATLSGTSTATLHVSSMVQGNYVFRLTVADNIGATAHDDVNVIVNAQTSSSSAIRISCGGANYTTWDGKLFASDRYHGSGTSVYTNNNITDIRATTEDGLYKKERSASVNLGNFSYNVPVSNGNYQVVLHFAEIFFGATGARPLEGQAGKRIFSVNIEGNRKIQDLDIIALAGSMAALIRSFDVNVTDGMLNIEFIAGVNRPKISAIEIVPLASTAAMTVTNTATEMNTMMEEVSEEQEELEFKAYPNPFSNEINFEFTPEKDVIAKLFMYNAIGLNEMEIFEGKAVAGKTLKFKVDTSNLEEGVYFYKISINGVVKFRKLILKR